MKKIAFSALFIATMLSGLYAQKTVELNFALTDFYGIDASNSFIINVEKGDVFSVQVVADDHIANKVKVSTSNGVLYFSLLDGKNYPKIKTLTAYVVMPELSSVKLSGACDLVSSDVFVSDKFKATLSGASDMKFNVRANEANIILSGASDMIMNVEAEKIELKTSGASDATLRGKAINATLTCSGSSNVIAPDFRIENASVKVSGSSDVKIHVENDLSAVASGASDVFYSGNPTIQSSLSGASSIRKIK
jgi:hypothetical protein